MGFGGTLTDTAFTPRPTLSAGMGVSYMNASDVVEMINAFNKGDKKRARAIDTKLAPLVKSMFIETNPIPVKTALALMGKIQEEFRLPLCEMAPAGKVKLRQVLADLKLI